MARLPIPGRDSGTWGDVLNEFLSVELNPDGTLKKSDEIAAAASDNSVVHNSTNETVGGVKAFSSSPTVPTPTAPTQAANKAYVDSTVSAGAVDATLTTKGIVKLAGDLAGTADLPTVPGLSNKEPVITAGTTGQYYRGDKSFQTLDKAAVGLSNVDNTSDASKPVSTATTTALNLKVDKSIVTTKGDILAATAASTLTRVGVGADGQILTADSASAPGVKWAPAPTAPVTSVVGQTGVVTGTQIAADPALTATFGLATKSILGPRWVFDGDSITVNSITTDATGNQNRFRSWTTEMARLSNGRIQYVYNAGVAGQRIDQALARFDSIITPQTPGVVLLTAGTNDIGQSRSMALWLTDLASYLAKCKAIGATLIVGEIWPTNETSVIPTRGAITRTWNQALYVWAAANGVQVIRWSALADPTTGGWPATWTTDFIHPTLLDSYGQIGAFGWASVEPKAGPAYTIPRAVINGEGLLSNGFFTLLGAVTTPPSGSTATGSTASGSLAAGTYSYKLTGRTFYGESLPSSAISATIGSTGQVSIGFTTPSGARGVNIYRKAPGDADWLFLVYAANGTSPYVDTGAATPGAAITGVDTSAIPSGIVRGTTLLRAISGPWILTEAGIRGNIIRLRQSGGADQDYVFGNVTAGVVYNVTCLIRGSGPGEGSVYARWRDAVGGSGAAVAQTIAYQQRFTTGWGLVYLRVTAPTGALSARISFETDSTIDYMDVAEVLFALA